MESDIDFCRWRRLPALPDDQNIISFLDLRAKIRNLSIDMNFSGHDETIRFTAGTVSVIREIFVDSDGHVL
jgi:hypothetical protein